MGSRVKTLNGNQAGWLRPCSSNPTPIHSVEEMEVKKLVKLKYEDLACYTDNFLESNYLSHFQFGKLYRGKIARDNHTLIVMVKIWEVSETYFYSDGDNQGRLMDEVMLLRHEMVNHHPGMLNLYGYCKESDHRLGVVYEFKPFASVFNLIPKDGFTWLQRIKVALGLASVLRFMHTKNGSFYKPYIVRNLDCAHLVVDEDYNPKLCDFGLISGGIFEDRTIYVGHYVLGSYGYIDVDSYYKGEFTVKQDVYAFGVILLNLISKRAYEVEGRGKPDEVYDWAWKEFSEFIKRGDLKNKLSLVHQSLRDDPDFVAVDGEKITWLALKCTESDINQRPTMKQVMRTLLKLRLVNRNVDFFGLKE